MESQSEITQTVSALKLPVLKTREYDLWSMRMEQYLTFTDHALWELSKMAQENYVEGCSMQRPPLLEPNGFCFWKARFKTYVKAKVTAIEEAKDLTTLPLDKLIENLKVYEMGGSDEDIDEEEEAEAFNKAFNLLARNFRKGGEILKPNGACYNCRIEGHYVSECRKPKENKVLIGGAWSDSEDGDEQPNDATCLMAINSQEVVSKPSSFNNDLNIIDLQNENEELLKFNKDFAKTFK
ncbi:zf-CCHC domain-containing protein [Tanacetum coccineum]